MLNKKIRKEGFREINIKIAIWWNNYL